MGQATLALRNLLIKVGIFVLLAWAATLIGRGTIRRWWVGAVGFAAPSQPQDVDVEGGGHIDVMHGERGQCEPPLGLRIEG
mgnify:CR=1 FL=1